MYLWDAVQVWFGLCSWDLYVIIEHFFLNRPGLIKIKITKHNDINCLATRATKGDVITTSLRN